MKVMKILFCVILSVVAGGAVAVLHCAVSKSSAAKTAVFTVFDKGAYRADIVVPENIGGVEKYAVEELTNHFQKAFGKTPEVVSENLMVRNKYPFHIYIGATKAAAAAGLPVGRLQDEEYCVKTVGNGLFLFGGDGDTKYEEVLAILSIAMRGTLYAVYDFLENEMGVKWIWPGRTGEVVPKRSVLKLGDISRRHREPLEFRHYYFGGCKSGIGFVSDRNAENFFKEQKLFMLRQRHGKRRDAVSGHSFTKWWGKYGKKHPEYFNLLPNGKRMPHRIGKRVSMCVSEPGVWIQRVAEWREWWHKVSHERHPPYPWVNCCENDGAGLCVCERCRSWDGPDPRFKKSPYWNGSIAEDFDKKCLGRLFAFDYGLSDGQRWATYPAPPTDELAASLSDRYVRFYNEVAAEAKKYHPEAKAIGYAYENYIDPPLKTRVGPDTIIIFVQRTYFPYDQTESDLFRKQWGGWYKMGARQMVYRPNYMLAGGNYPIDMSRRILDDFAFAYTNGMFAVSHDSLHGSWSAHAMQLYAVSRSFRDPLRGHAKAREDFLSAFGAAAPAVCRYLDMVEKHSGKWTYEAFHALGHKNFGRNRQGGSFLNPNSILGDFYEESFFVSGYAALDEAVLLAGNDDEVKRRIAFLRAGLRDTELGRRCRIAHKASVADSANKEKKAAYEAAFKSLLDYRASVEHEPVCNYCYISVRERNGIGWPHKLGDDKPVSKE